MTTPVTFASPVAPASYSWEATNEQVAARYGLPVESIARFDLNTSPVPPPAAARVLAAQAFDVPVSEYPPSDYRRLVEAASLAYGVAEDEILVGAGADEVIDLCGKAFVGPGRAAVAAVPTYAMFRVSTEQRGARYVGVPRADATDGWTIDRRGIVDVVAEADASLVWLCNPNNPTASVEPAEALAALLDDLEGAASAAGTTPPTVVLDEAYAEFVDRSLVDLRIDHSNLVVVRTLSKAYALAGLRVGFALARPETIAELAPYRPPGSVSVASVAVATAALADPDAMRANVAFLGSERRRLAHALRGAGWAVGPSVTNFLLVDFGTPETAASTTERLLSRGLVPRTFPAGHPLARMLRITVRSVEENDRLIAAAQEIAAAPGNGVAAGAAT